MKSVHDLDIRLSMIERMHAYSLATGMKPVGIHRRLTDHVVMRLGTRCDSCDGSGVQLTEDRRHFCSDCQGFLRRLPPAGVVRLYQIVSARFPELRSRVPIVQAAVDRWADRKPPPVNGAVYFGLDELPVAVPPRPDATALPV